MADAKIRIHGAIVTLLREPEEEILLLCVEIPDPPHETILRYTPSDGTRAMTAKITDPLKFQVQAASTASHRHEHVDLDKRVLFSRHIGLTVPLQQRAQRIVYLPPGSVRGRRPYDCRWKVGDEWYEEMCSEIEVELPDVETLLATNGPDRIAIDPSRPVDITHLPRGADHDRGDIPKMTHFREYGLICHGVRPDNIHVPQGHDCGTLEGKRTVASVCPPVYHQE